MLWRSERKNALRVTCPCGQGVGLPVVCRKAWGGNRTWAGAQTWQVLSSVLATAHLQRCDPVALLVPLPCAPGPVLAGLVIPGAARGP
jgi:hypothetical protein